MDTTNACEGSNRMVNLFEGCEHYTIKMRKRAALRAFFGTRQKVECSDRTW
jgi:hypothetical protein